MAEIIRMPLLSDTMTEGVIVEWHKKVGDTVKADEPIADVETDKATMEVIPYVDGTLLYIGVEVGEAVPVSSVIAVIGEKGEDYEALLKAEGADGASEQKSTEEPKEEQPVKKTEKAAPKESLPADVSVIRMPLMSDTMTEGTIVGWLKKVGDKVAADDPIAEVETDKATMEVIPYVEGKLLYIGVEEGDVVPVNQIIAIIADKDHDVDKLLSIIEAESSESTSATAAEPEKESSSAAQTQTTEEEDFDDGGRIKASPLAKRIAKDKGISLRQVEGTGDGGRIIKKDIETFIESGGAEKAKTAAKKETTSGFTAPVLGQESYEDISLSQMRKTVARRLGESKFSAPHFYLKMSIKMDNAMEARKAMNEVSEHKISFNDYIIKACAAALRRHPQVNSSWMGDFIRENHHINIGTAVAVDEGLIVPVIKHADLKSLSQIAGESRELIQKARDKKLQPEEFTGNTFTVSNLGMMDIDDFTAIINPPDACILAIGKINPEPVVENGEIVIRHILRLSLSCDHRVVDGAVGATFMQTLKSFLENPANMLV
ncbi:MAG TPA: pyruvate dehydrogenase complex dihydrolipoamide acetyltransferase [Chitinophagaceae bacterium]|nr:pyruvate dehydrogenase complex dihydrolipoamide acetyltransferase [Chitinophagaceae bacterium]